MRCIHELFETQAQRSPESRAVQFEDRWLTYAQLDRRADLVAEQLRSVGVEPGVLVGLFLERSLDLVVGLLGILKAGGAYVPLDPFHPRKRLAAMLADARPGVLLTQQNLRSDLPPHEAQVVVIDADRSTAAVPVSLARRAGNAADLAYVIYTSGSTGQPKGVEITHGAVVNMLASMRRRPGLTAEDRMLAITTVGFDIAVLELFLPLTCGASLVIAPGALTIDGEALARLIEGAGVSVMQATPATLRMLLDAGWQGAPDLKILCGGEAWPAELARQLLPRCASLWNMYGPTETTVWSAVAKVEAGQPVVVGRPIAKTRFYVLDGTSDLVPVGVPGELHIAGDGLARGYLNRPELTRERFVPDPFVPEPGARMYRTGDLVRRLPDGTMEFLGRLDHQVKIRGHRVELGEIEAVLERDPRIERCAVIAADDAHGDRRLIAYFLPADGIAVSSGELRRRLAETLPAYMIPAVFVPLNAFPLSPSGKLDRNALPPPDGAMPQSDTASDDPATPTERALVPIWCRMLGLEKVGLRDNFFELGGHSLMAVRLVGEINSALQVHLNVPTFFLNPTIKFLARVLDEKHHVRSQPRVVPMNSGRRDLPVYFVGTRPEDLRLAGALGDDRTIFAIDAPMPAEWHRAMLDKDWASAPSFEDLGALYGEVLRTHAGSSPCVIVGYSLGGKIALEATRVLRRAGMKVAAVIVLDTWALAWDGATRGPVRYSLGWIWRQAMSTGRGSRSLMDRAGVALGDYWRLLRWLVARLPETLRLRLEELRSDPVLGTNPSGYLDSEGKPIDQTVLNEWGTTVATRWCPPPVDVPGVLIRTQHPYEKTLPGFDIAHGWSRIFEPGLEIIQTTGDHGSMVMGEDAETLVQKIRAVITRYERIPPDPRPAEFRSSEPGPTRNDEPRQVSLRLA
jgi:amino acid adenylation domain-containing protein